jgi:hypothetical protein
MHGTEEGRKEGRDVIELTIKAGGERRKET